MMKIQLILIMSLSLSSIMFGQNAKDLNIDYMVDGRLFIEKFNALDHSHSSPQKMGECLQFSESGFFLKIDTTQKIIFADNINGYKLYICNKSDTARRIQTIDSQIPIIAEVFYNGTWNPIESLWDGWCGNSYRRTTLIQNEYLVFNIPKYTGEINTTMRYKLWIPKDKYIYSNEIPTNINLGQLYKKKGGGIYCFPASDTILEQPIFTISNLKFTGVYCTKKQPDVYLETTYIDKMQEYKVSFELESDKIVAPRYVPTIYVAVISTKDGRTISATQDQPEVFTIDGQAIEYTISDIPDFGDKTIATMQMKFPVWKSNKPKKQQDASYLIIVYTDKRMLGEFKTTFQYKR